MHEEKQSRAVNVHPLERLACVAGGSALAISGLRGGFKGAARTLTGAMLVYRGLSGQCQVYKALGVRTAGKDDGHTIPYESGVQVESAVTVNAPKDRVYDFWRDIENLPRFMKHLVSVERIDDKRSRWVAKGPANVDVKWDAEIINDIPGKLIAWRSLPDSQVDSAGSVNFRDIPGGTEIRVKLQYNPPGGEAAAMVARVFGREPQQEIDEDLCSLKEYLERGQTAVSERLRSIEAHA